ncbi:MAG: murein biosynthesis integral membrane protein MurJ [Actinobacteria bacterium]|nr:MAG: murein biosynthesis integral membrane protein MurJ [Actinomycetota bacterium]
MTGLVRSNVVVATGTALSRLTGLIRIIIFGVIIGQTALADAFDGANNSPNSIYELLIGGVLAASLVPLFTSILDDPVPSAGSNRSQLQGVSGVDAIVSVALVVLTAITVFSIIASPAIFHLFSFHPDPSVDAIVFRRAGTALTRIFVVQIFFYGLSALCSALLNARRRFFAAAWTPALSNSIAIVFLLAIRFTGDATQPQLQDVLGGSKLMWLLGLSTTVGIGAMALVQLAAVKRSGIAFTFHPQFSHPAVRKLMRLSVWTLGYVIANQVALIVIKNLASPGSGLVDAYSKAFILFQLPHGLLAVSIATTFLPDLARFATNNDAGGYAQRMSHGITLTALFTIPASFGLFVLSKPIIGLLLQHGNFSAAATINTSRALSGLALGLAGFSVYLFVLRGFYARHDTRTPFFINLGENAINIVLAIVLVDRYDVLGLGLSFSIAYLLSAAIALAVLAKTSPLLSLRVVGRDLARTTIAGAGMAVVVVAVSKHIGSTVGMGALLRVSVGVLVGALSYLVLLVVLREPHCRNYWSTRTTKSSR